MNQCCTRELSAMPVSEHGHYTTGGFQCKCGSSWKIELVDEVSPDNEQARSQEPENWWNDNE
ncbi:hypothetical protein LCGC14_1416620 [marine sediment metagenome]|uniref:Uncharacterized protein n=1 Tax=marine sediment metagenome TaxID=412755 RepID=A0A0F9KDX1_9ZZZZ